MSFFTNWLEMRKQEKLLKSLEKDRELIAHMVDITTPPEGYDMSEEATIKRLNKINRKKYRSS